MYVFKKFSLCGLFMMGKLVNDILEDSATEHILIRVLWYCRMCHNNVWRMKMWKEKKPLMFLLCFIGSTNIPNALHLIRKRQTPPLAKAMKCIYPGTYSRLHSYLGLSGRRSRLSWRFIFMSNIHPLFLFRLQNLASLVTSSTSILNMRYTCAFSFCWDCICWTSFNE